MAVEVITFEKFKEIPSKTWERAHKRDDSSIVLVDADENEYLLEDVEVETIGSHLAVSADGERVFVRTYRHVSEAERWLPLLALPLLFLLATKGAEYLKTKLTGPASSDITVQEKIQALKDVEVSISKVSQYVASQKQSLEETSKMLESLKKEKDAVEAALQINRDQLDALLATVRQDSEKEKWIERIVSFITGIISSLIATKCWESWAKGRHDEG